MKYLKLFAVLFCACLFWGCDDYNYSQLKQKTTNSQEAPTHLSGYSQWELERMLKAGIIKFAQKTDRYFNYARLDSIQVKNYRPYKAVGRMTFRLNDISYYGTKVYIDETQDNVYEINIYQYLTDSGPWIKFNFITDSKDILLHESSLSL